MVGGRKCWCGTLQLENELFDGQEWLNKLYNNKIIEYGVGQIELGSHYHFQMYLRINKEVSLAWMKKHINEEAHWEPRKGSTAQARDYCMKEETRVAGPWEVGCETGMGRRSDLDRAAEMIDEGASLREVALENKAVFIRYHRGLAAYQAITKSKGPRDIFECGPEVWVFWGTTGTGKSHQAYIRWPDAYRKPTNDKWWDGYRGQETVVFDDFKGSSMKLQDFQLVIDKYPIDIEVKGGYIPLSATRYVFTSNKHPSEWYSTDADPDGSVMRRIDDYCKKHGRLIHCLPGFTMEPEGESGGKDAALEFMGRAGPWEE